MGLRDRLKGLFGAEQADEALHFYVECDRCGARLHIRVHKQFDIMPDFEGKAAYFFRKEMMDDRCFQLMYATVWLDENYNVVDAEVQGGHFISREEYEAGVGDDR